MVTGECWPCWPTSAPPEADPTTRLPVAVPRNPQPASLQCVGDAVLSGQLKGLGLGGARGCWPGRGDDRIRLPEPRPGKQPGIPGTTMALMRRSSARWPCAARLRGRHRHRDGYAGSGHLTDALHAWCGVHVLRDLKGLYGFEPGKQEWTSQMAGLLIEARNAASAARQAGQTRSTATLRDQMRTDGSNIAPPTSVYNPVHGSPTTGIKTAGGAGGARTHDRRIMSPLL